MFSDNQIASKILNILHKTKTNVYITGEAGTGKSTLIQEFLKNTQKNIALLAPTGMAAVNIGGETIHSFCKFSLDPAFKIIQDNKITRIKNKKLKKLDAIIIDEVSMVRADTLDAMNMFFQKNLNNKNPFGGIQVILIGDHFQLPPILRQDEKTEFHKLYPNVYFFSSKVYSELKLQNFKLTRIYRQKEIKYIKLLNYLRYGVNDIRVVNWINNNLLNKKINPKQLPITIATRNIDVMKINRTRLESLPNEVFSYKAVIGGSFKKEVFPTEKYLVLKEDAQVMFVRNDSEKKWVNGTIGKIKELNKDYIVVKLNNGKKVHIAEETWEVCRYDFSEETQKLEKIVIGSFSQYPLKLAWAVTIHKSQGQTFENCLIDMGQGAFVYGQTYVAFSRCTKLEGLGLKSPISQTDIKCDPDIIVFEKSTNWNRENLTK